MKVKFDLSEDDRLKAYYLLQLRNKLNPSGASSEIPFDQFLNEFALVQFRIGIDDDIASLEVRLFGSEA